jgi:hydrogenase maturation factor
MANWGVALSRRTTWILVRIGADRIPLGPDVAALCRHLGMDPDWALAEGALIACVRPDRVPAALEALAEVGIPATEIGEVATGPGLLRVLEPGGATTTIDTPLADPYWPVYATAIAEGWD